MTATNDGLSFVLGPRKYAAKLASFDMPYYYYECAEGQHGFGTVPEQLALHDAIFYTYLAERLIPPRSDVGLRTRVRRR